MLLERKMLPRSRKTRCGKVSRYCFTYTRVTNPGTLDSDISFKNNIEFRGISFSWNSNQKLMRSDKTNTGVKSEIRRAFWLARNLWNDLSAYHLLYQENIYFAEWDPYEQRR